MLRLVVVEATRWAETATMEVREVSGEAGCGEEEENKWRASIHKNEATS